MPDLVRRLPYLKIRHTVVAAIREYFDRNGFIEVETPLLLDTVAPEEHIVPISCGQGYLATSPELQMKQLVAAGLSRCYQLTRSFRAGEQGRRHSPEFTILEWYKPGDSVHDLAADLEGLFAHVALRVTGGSAATWQGRTVDYAGPFRVTSVADAFERWAGWNPVTAFDSDRFDLDLVDKVEPHLGRGRPEVLAFYPRPVASLARALPENPAVAQRLELYVEGMELANGFVELTDPDEQERRFEETRAVIAASGRTPPPIPRDYLACLPQLPDTVGIALGVDRMVMLFSDAAHIDQVRGFGPSSPD